MTATLVTGGLGFVGAPLCEALAARGDRVLCADRLGGSYSPLRGQAAARALAEAGVEVVKEDARGVSLTGVDAVVHLAALPGVRASRSAAELWRENVELTTLVLARAARAGGRVVLASSSSVYGEASVQPTPESAPAAPLGPYARSKLEAERAAFFTRGADVVVVRPFTVFGPGQRPDMAIARWIAALLDGRPIDWRVHPGGARELTYVDDAVAGIVAALDRGRAGEAYNVGGASHRLADVLARLEAIAGPRASATVTAACRAKSARELGYRPRVSLEEGLKRQVAAAAAADALVAA
jgi:nucleoside-diphosphate-sugar epimerase